MCIHRRWPQHPMDALPAPVCCADGKPSARFPAGRLAECGSKPLERTVASLKNLVKVPFCLLAFRPLMFHDHISVGVSEGKSWNLQKPNWEGRDALESLVFLSEGAGGIMQQGRHQVQILWNVGK